MDPDVCVRRINDAIADGDRREEAAARKDLAEWLANGGFPPRRPPPPARRRKPTGTKRRGRRS